MNNKHESFTFTVGKLDAGMAILLGERAHLIEFPSILLPPGAIAGSIVNIAVHQNHAEEKRRDGEFWALQNEILNEFGVELPEAPELKLRNVTQTSVTLEWPSIKLATAKLRSLDIYRNSQRLAAIPSPMTNTSTKLSGLDMQTEYSFQLILRTTAGTFPSNLIRVRTHSIEDTSGICVCFGNCQDDVLLENAKMALREMNAKWSDKIQIDTTHFVCTTPATTPNGAQASGSASGAPGVEYQRALQLSIPVVTPHWILACHSEKRMVAIGAYYLGAEPSASTHSFRPQSMSQASQSTSSLAARTNRASLPAPARKSPTFTTMPATPESHSAFVNQPNSLGSPIAEEESPSKAESTPPSTTSPSLDDSGASTPTATKRKSRSGTMNRDFRFPPNATETGAARKSPPAALPVKQQGQVDDEGEGEQTAKMITPSAIEVPPPPPVEKERSTGSLGSRHSNDEGDDDVGDTVEVDLS
ncbi:fibronectin type III/BRCA1 domain-containing protein [Lentinula aff. detonsa]|uniref:Fibronectin type III/BRCA1 domain-containing protein n=1 Tax=Lentinula aff. detonsa TaxID=2804958 RepID=A0AA38L6L3_9AGAR|nr:fibronectin type III/BRCA1 domain-containing protein [Lentinula aff. detonsa]KAJ3801211.1 fibronectin type III/BRCA1 domain-containing protein [Lentinula aff. detonsa]